MDWTTCRGKSIIAQISPSIAGHINVLDPPAMVLKSKDILLESSVGSSGYWLRRSQSVAIVRCTSQFRATVRRTGQAGRNSRRFPSRFGPLQGLDRRRRVSVRVPGSVEMVEVRGDTNGPSESASGCDKGINKAVGLTLLFFFFSPSCVFSFQNSSTEHVAWFVLQAQRNARSAKSVFLLDCCPKLRRGPGSRRLTTFGLVCVPDGPPFFRAK